MLNICMHLEIKYSDRRIKKSIPVVRVVQVFELILLRACVSVIFFSYFNVKLVETYMECIIFVDFPASQSGANRNESNVSVHRPNDNSSRAQTFSQLKI